MHMHLLVKNIGPFSEAEVGPLEGITIFVGRNGVGKSYLSYLIWSLFEVEPNWLELHRILSKPLEGLNSTEDVDESLGKPLKESLKEAFESLNTLFSDNLEILLKDVFTVDSIHKVIKKGKDRGQICIYSDDYSNWISCSLSKNGISFDISSSIVEYLESEVEIDISQIQGKVYLDLYIEGVKQDSKVCGSLAEMCRVVAGFIPVVFAEATSGYVPHTSPLIAPDSRSGIIRMREEVMSRAFSPRYGEFMKMNQIDSVFVRDMEALHPTEQGGWSKQIADFIEEGAEVSFYLQREPPRYVVEMESGRIPLEKAPSGYRELSPLVYLMKYGKIGERYPIIIEEPESHLHPDLHSRMIRALGGLSLETPVIFTTHSLSTLDEVSNLIRLSNLSEEEKEDLGFEKWERLDPESIAIFVLSEGGAEKIEITEEGLSETELDKIYLEISNSHSKVEWVADEHKERNHAREDTK